MVYLYIVQIEDFHQILTAFLRDSWKNVRHGLVERNTVDHLKHVTKIHHGQRNVSMCVSVCVSALCRLNCLTYGPKF